MEYILFFPLSSFIYSLSTQLTLRCMPEIQRCLALNDDVNNVSKKNPEF